MDYSELNDTNFEEFIKETQGGLLLFYKKLCPHCLNMKKVIEKVANTQGLDTSIMFIDSEQNSKSMGILNVELVPTILIIKQGKVKTKKTGLMNPRELTALYKNA